MCLFGSLLRDVDDVFLRFFLSYKSVLESAARQAGKDLHCLMGAGADVPADVAQELSSILGDPTLTHAADFGCIHHASLFWGLRDLPMFPLSPRSPCTSAAPCAHSCVFSAGVVLTVLQHGPLSVRGAGDSEGRGL